MQRRNFLKALPSSIGLTTLASSFTLNAAVKESTTISVEKFGLYANSGEDSVPALTEALAYCKAHPGCSLVFPKGRYDFWYKEAPKDFYYITNNDDGEKRVAFPIAGFKHFTIDGQGSEFIFHGGMVPFIVKESIDINLKNFTIDWDVPFHCESIVLGVNEKEKYVDVKVKPGFTYQVNDNKLAFVGEGFINTEVKNFLAFDTKKREQAYLAKDNYQKTITPHVTELSPRVLRLKTNFRSYPKVGNTFLLMQNQRLYPAIALQDSKNTWLENIIIHHSGAMGVVGQKCDGVSLKKVEIMPREGSGRLVSTTVDATHFSNCKGHIVYQNCQMRNQMDDAINVHGVYARLTEVIDSHSAKFELVHFQQLGINIFETGNEITLSDGSLQIYQTNKIVNTERHDAKYWTVKFEQPLPKSTQIEDVLDNLTWQPTSVLIKDCIFANNRARGVLISVPSKVLIANNYFHNPNFAIKIGSGGRKWYESGPVHSVEIRNNLIDNCNYGKAAGPIDIVVKNQSNSTKAFHHNINIHDNDIRVYSEMVLQANRTYNVNFINNKITKTQEYPEVKTKHHAISVRNSSNMHIQGNEFIGFSNKSIVEIDKHSKNHNSVFVEEKGNV